MNQDHNPIQIQLKTFRLTFIFKLEKQGLFGVPTFRLLF